MKKFAIAALALALSVNANAAFDCNVKVQNVLIYGDGMVNVLHSGRGDYTVICNLNANYGSVTPVTCAMWTGMLQVIKKKNGLANFYFGGEGSCAAIATYASAPVPVYIGDITP